MKCKCWFASIDSKWNRELMLLHRCHLPAAQLQCNATPLLSNPGSPLERVIINISIVILWRNTHFASGRTTNKKLRFSWRWKAGPDQGGKPEVPDLQTSPPPFSCSIAQHTGLYKACDWPSMNCTVCSQLCWTNLDTGGDVSQIVPTGEISCVKLQSATKNIWGENNQTSANIPQFYCLWLFRDKKSIEIYHAKYIDIYLAWKLRNTIF